MKRELMGGIHSVEALLTHAPERVVRLWARAGNARIDEVIKKAKSLGLSVELSNDSALDKKLPNVIHQGIMAEFSPAQPLDEFALLNLIESTDHPMVVLLDGVQDPHNLGAILRSAAAAGATAVVVSKDRACGLTPAARKASAGASEWFPLCVVTNLSRTLSQLKKAGLWVVGLEAEHSKSVFCEDYQQWFRGPIALVMGSEGQGLRRLTQEQCDGLAHIPMPGNMESLNVSVAAAIVLFSVVRARE